MLQTIEATRPLVEDASGQYGIQQREILPLEVPALTGSDDVAGMRQADEAESSPASRFRQMAGKLAVAGSWVRDWAGQMWSEANAQIGLAYSKMADRAAARAERPSRYGSARVWFAGAVAVNMVLSRSHGYNFLEHISDHAQAASDAFGSDGGHGVRLAAYQTGQTELAQIPVIDDDAPGGGGQGNAPDQTPTPEPEPAIPDSPAQTAGHWWQRFKEWLAEPLDTPAVPGQHVNDDAPPGTVMTPPEPVVVPSSPGGGPPPDVGVPSFTPQPESTLPTTSPPPPAPVPRPSGVPPVPAPTHSPSAAPEAAPVPAPAPPHVPAPGVSVEPPITTGGYDFSQPVHPGEYLWTYMDRIGVPENRIMADIKAASAVTAKTHHVEWHYATNMYGHRVEWLEINGRSDTSYLVHTMGSALQQAAAR